MAAEACGGRLAIPMSEPVNGEVQMDFVGESLKGQPGPRPEVVEQPVLPPFGFMDREREDLKMRWPRVMALLTCLAMVLVVAHQGGTIDQQQSLIRLLWGDSKQLTQMRVNEIQKQREQMYLTDPQHSAPSEKPPAAKPAPKPKAEPEPEPTVPTLKTARILWRT